MTARSPSRKLLRARVFHTPGNPFTSDRGLEAFFDGGVAIEQGRVVAVGEFSALRKRYLGFEVKDLRPGVLLPGFVDAHVHFPQLYMIGAMWLRLMDWLKLQALARPRANQVRRDASVCFEHFAGNA